MEPFVVTVASRPDEETLYNHDGEEFLLILKGKAEILLEDERILLEEGDAVYFDASLRHRLLSCGDGETQVLAIEVRNDSDARFLLRNTSSWTFHQAPDVMELAPHESTILRVKTMQRLGEVALSFEVLNALVAPKTHLTWSTTVRVPDEPPGRPEESP